MSLNCRRFQPPTGYQETRKFCLPNIKWVSLINTFVVGQIRILMHFAIAVVHYYFVICPPTTCVNQRYFTGKEKLFLKSTLLHKKQCRTLLTAVHQPAKSRVLTMISRVIDAQKMNFQYTRTGASKIIPLSSLVSTFRPEYSCTSTNWWCATYVL